MCVCVCVYRLIHNRTHTYIRTDTNTHRQIYTHVHARAHTHTHTYTHIYIYMHTPHMYDEHTHSHLLYEEFRASKMTIRECKLHIITISLQIGLEIVLFSSLKYFKCIVLIKNLAKKCHFYWVTVSFKRRW